MTEIELERLSIEECERRGWEVRTVRTPRDRRGHAHDLLGMFDLLAARPDSDRWRTVAIQLTDSGNMAARVKKLLAHDNLEFVRNLGWTVVVWGWRDNGTLREAYL